MSLDAMTAPKPRQILSGYKNGGPASNKLLMSFIAEPIPGEVLVVDVRDHGRHPRPREPR